MPACPSLRPDANRIALDAIRSILEAAAPVELAIAGAPIDVRVERIRGRGWPSSGLLGLDPGEHGPWPEPVKLACRWANGETKLVMSAAVTRGGGALGHMVGLRVAVMPARKSLVRVGLPLALRGDDGERVWIPAPFHLVGGGDAPEVKGGSRGAALRRLVERAGMPLASAWSVEAFAVRLPEGEVLPLPHDAFARVLHLALLKLPFVADGTTAIEGAPPFDVAALEADEALGVSNDVRLARVHPLPGGVRRYKATLDALLVFITRARPTIDDFRDALLQRYDVTNATIYVRLLEGTGLVRRDGDALALTDRGRAYLEAPEPERLFDELHARYLGFLETLVIAADEGATGDARTQRVLEGLLGRRWKTSSQVGLRRNWLLSMGLTDRAERGDVATALGRRVLHAHAGEAAEIRRRIEDLHEEERDAATLDLGPVETDEDDADEIERVPEERRAEAGDVPPAWLADRLDLGPELLRPHLRGLALPAPLLDRVAAALSAGKHLILVGPPGTGKTELAHAVGEAARQEGYCHGLLGATASADWATFDTVGGYAMQKDGSLHFRPGVFLGAIERQQWLLIDELNRADVDRAFGELMTVLSGRGTVTPFALDDGRLVSIGPEADRTHRVPRTFRVIATMNTWDKTSLFRLSYAVQRRFAIVHVDVPDDAAYARLVRSHATDKGVDPPLDPAALARFDRLFTSAALFAIRPIGPAIAIDMIRYLRRRGGGGDGFAEAIAIYLLPQLEGLDDRAAVAARELLEATLTGWASAPALAELCQRYDELFPHLGRGAP